MLNVIGKSKFWFTFSGILILLGMFAFVSNTLTKGSPMNFGIDFTGGTVLNLRFDSQASLSEIRNILSKYGKAQSVIQRSEGNDIIINTDPLSTDERGQIMSDITAKFPAVELLEADTIGPVVGSELRRQALWAITLAIIGILIYVAFRFEFKYAVAAVIALFHDAIITAGLIALLWRPVDTAFIAAILTILGYSINDTIVIFDRIRENLLKPGALKKPLADLVNESINQTMARSINTVLTVLFMNLALLIFGGATIKDFALVLFIGFALGGYSSIFIASPLVVMLDKWEKSR
ncbi:MAG: protein translocase subunit SecF [bacterium]